jgi:flagellar hook-basal body complex protein FliE
MAISGIDPRIPQIPSIQSVQDTKTVSPEGASKGSFGELLQNAIKEVDGLQAEADKQIEGLTLKKEGVTPHTAMLALEKADVAFQLMTAIRGKIVRAYEEVIRTQV